MRKSSVQLQKDIFPDSDMTLDDLPGKKADRALYLRRKLEDHHAAKQLYDTFGDQYWNTLDDVS